MNALLTAKRLANGGRFREALSALGESLAPRTERTAAEVFRAALLERVGHFGPCRELATSLLKSKELKATEISACECTLGLIDWDEGHTDNAIKHLQRSVLTANRANDLERLCWSQLRLWLMLADRRDVDAAAPIFSELRSNSIKLGDSYVSAAIHVFVAEIEAKRGLLVSAQMHTRVALNLMASDHNPWLEASAENINVAIALMSSDFESGFPHGRRAVELAEQSGAAAILRACLGNYGNLLHMAGRLDEASEYFERARSILPSSGDNGNAAIDAIASTRLAQDRVEEAEQLLDGLENSIRTADDRKLYVFRHAALTRVRLLMRQQRWTEALSGAEELLRIAQDAGDEHLHAMTSLIRAEILLRTASVSEATRSVHDIVPKLPSLPPDFYARYEGLLASALALAGHPRAAQSHLERARRILVCGPNAPASLDIDRNWSATLSKLPPALPSDNAVADWPHASSVNVVVQAAASLFLHTRQPEFLAREVLHLLKETGCVRHAAGVATTPSTTPAVLEQFGSRSDRDLKRLDVGRSGDRTIEIVADVNPDPESIATVNSISFLLSAVRDLARAHADREEQVRLWPTDEQTTDLGGAVLTGQLQKLTSFAQRIAKTTVSVLITGESGTGKEILARAIHGYSSRTEKPFVPFNCTAIPRELLESQLFGHRRGAFTGADRDNPGLIRSATDGTLFLDEIGELGLDLQPKLLRFLESGEICPLGEARPFIVDVRIIAATNSNLERLVHEGRFREDLFYRLNVIRLTIPPLRERRDEIPPLVHHFLARAAGEFSKGRVRIAEETMEHLLLYPWPGNVRQLQNELRRMVALAEPDAVLTPADLTTDIRIATPQPAARAGNGQELAVPLADKLLPTLSRIEREMIKVALRAHPGHVDAAAKSLGISRKGLYLKRQRLGL